MWSDFFRAIESDIFRDEKQKFPIPDEFLNKLFPSVELTIVLSLFIPR